MAGADVKIVRQAYDAWNRGDEAFFEFLDPEVEWIPAAQFVESGAVHGIDGFRRLLDSFKQVFEEIRYDPLRIQEGAEAGEVVAVLAMHTRGKGSGAEVEIRVAHLLRLRKGKVVWGKIYPNAEEGLRAAGVEPAE